MSTSAVRPEPTRTRARTQARTGSRSARLWSWVPRPPWSDWSARVTGGTGPDADHRVVLAGLAGSMLLTFGSFGAGAMPVYDPIRHAPVLSLLRHGIGEQVALAAVYAGLALLGTAWLYLGRAVRHGAAGTGQTRLFRIGALWAAPLLVSVPLFSRDLYSYAAQAQLTHAGLDPYTQGPASLPGPFLDEISRMWVDTPAPYGPLWLTLGRLIATITQTHVLLTVLALRLLAVGGVLLMARYLPRLAEACGADPRAALWLGLLNPLVLVHFVAGGHNDALMLGLVVAGLTIAVEATSQRGLALGVAVTTLAVLIKAPAVIAIGFLGWVWASRLTGPSTLLRGCLRVAAVALATFTAVTLATGLGLGWVHQLNTPGAVVAWVSIPTGLGMLVDALAGVHQFITSADPVISAMRTAGQVATVAVVAGLWLGARRLGAVRALALALLTVVLFGPVVQPWYVVWAIAIGATGQLPRRLWQFTAGASVWLSMMIAPQGANLFLEISPVVATSAAVAVVTYAVLGHKPGVTEPTGDGNPVPATTVV